MIEDIEEEKSSEIFKNREFFAFYDKPDIFSQKGSAHFEPEVISEMRD